MATLEGTQLGPYLVGGQIGSGGMATVYKAYHARLDRHVAIKVMHDAFQQDENFLARFEREAQIVARLEHPNIVPIYDFADVEARPYLVMKFIEGTTLKQKMFKNPPTLAEIKRILPAIAGALDYAHQRGILHRDIKPSNVILDANGIPYLMDFGLARIAQLGESTLSQDSILGTPQYISPEQAMGKRDLTPATDLYSLGVVLYELVTGRVPFASDTPFATIHDHIYTALPLPSTVNPELPPALDQVLDKAMAKRPEDRFKTASEMVNAFLQTVEQAHLETLNADRREVAPPPVRTPPLDDALTTPLPKGDSNAPARKVVMMGEDGKPKRQVEAKIDFDLNNVNWNEVARGTGDFVRTWGERIERFGSELDAKSKAKDPLLSKDPDSIRRRIEQQFKKRNEFIGHLISYVLVNGVLWLLFGLANGGEINIEGEVISVGSFPWPLIVMLGWGAGLVAHGIETYFQTGGRMRHRQITIERELMRQYGDDWQDVTDAKSVKAVRKRVEKPFKKLEEFYQHLGVYILINVMLWIIYGFSFDGASFPIIGEMNINEMVDMSFPWPLMVTLGWGIGLFANAMEALSAPVSERAIQRAIEQEQARMITGKAKRSENPASVVLPRVRMNADGEFTDSMVEELGELEAGQGVPNRIENYNEQDDDNESNQGRSRQWRVRNRRR